MFRGRSGLSLIQERPIKAPANKLAATFSPTAKNRVTPSDFSKLLRPIHSQDGEDGLLVALMDRLGIKSGYFVEFGAADGPFVSNTWVFHQNKDWRGCYIEGANDRFASLKKNIDASRVVAVNTFVTATGPNTLDAILARAGAPKEIEVLSIDIDSDDYIVWEAVKEHSAKIVVIEYNPTIPNSFFYVQPKGKHIGNSARALYELGARKGYMAILATETNLIFARSDVAAKLGAQEVPLNALREDLGAIFYGYGGSVVVSDRMARNPWNGRPLALALEDSPPTLSMVRKVIRSWVKNKLGGKRGPSYGPGN